MPQYHNKKNWKNRGRVKITPRPFTRNLPILKYFIPYHVGDRVRFHLDIDKPNSDFHEGMFSHFVFERFGSDIYQFPHDINGLNADIEGSIIPSEGDVEYSIGLSRHYENPETIITMRVENWDTFISKWGWAFVGAFFSLLCVVAAWLLNIIQVNPAWKLIVK